jgi:hypothetical protein
MLISILKPILYTKIDIFFGNTKDNGGQPTITPPHIKRSRDEICAHNIDSAWSSLKDAGLAVCHRTRNLYGFDQLNLISSTFKSLMILVRPLLLLGLASYRPKGA